MPAFHQSRLQPQADLATLAPLPAAAERYRVLRADLHCYLCAQTFGALEGCADGANAGCCPLLSG
jgi:hypothetical protein